MSLKKDLEVTADIIRHFFSEDRIKRTLALLGETWGGCEGWLQVELWQFLKGKNDIAEAMREAEYKLDGRKTSHQRAYADIAFRKKNSSKDWWVVIEMKAKHCASTCVEAMMKDWDKIDSVSRSEDDIRNFWLLGVFSLGKKTPELMHANILERLREEDEGIRQEHVVCEGIGDTKLAWALF